MWKRRRAGWWRHGGPRPCRRRGGLKRRRRIVRRPARGGGARRALCKRHDGPHRAKRARGALGAAVFAGSVRQRAARSVLPARARGQDRDAGKRRACGGALRGLGCDGIWRADRRRSGARCDTRRKAHRRSRHRGDAKGAFSARRVDHAQPSRSKGVCGMCGRACGARRPAERALGGAGAAHRRSCRRRSGAGLACESKRGTCGVRAPEAEACFQPRHRLPARLGDCGAPCARRTPS